ncbi:LysR family transcriptional regulator [Frigidibacter sp. MR17.24]|uniref:LysR family transcriptional regulator n=1 Tax=Frigidibacter sp. MR17.24 TaxID=3127345 RepID=UPI00301309F6
MDYKLGSSKNVSIKQIRAFLAVASTRNFSKAADDLCVSASALSLTIRDLERSIGRKLFERTTRAVAFTEAGSYFYPLAERLMTEFVTAIDEVATFDRVEREVMRVAASEPVMNLLVSRALRGWAEDEPDIALDLSESTTQDVIKGVIEHRYDIGVTTLWTKIDGVNAFPLVEDQLGVLMHPGNPLACSNEPLSWEAMRNERIVSFLDGAGLKARVERDPNFGYLVDRATHHASSSSGLKVLVRNGFGSAIVAAISAESTRDEGFVFRALIDPPGWRSLYIITPQDIPLSEPVRRLIRDMIATLDRFADNPYIRPCANPYRAV